MIFGNWFGRKTDTGYSNVSTEDLLSKFRTENWSQMNSEERLGTFQELENRYAKEQHRPAAKIEAEGNNANLGSYSSAGNTIKIRVDDFPGNNSYEQLDSYYHESRHAQQTQAIKKGRGLDEDTRDMCQVEMARSDDGHLYNYTNSEPYYDLQACEMDSNNFAAGKLLDNQQLFQDDPEYGKYIQERQKHFEEVNNKNEEYADMNARMKNAKIDRSLENRDISKGQASRMKERIYNDENSPVQDESKAIEARLKDYNPQDLNKSNNSTEKALQAKQQKFFEDDDSNSQLAAKSDDEMSKEKKFFEDDSSKQVENNQDDSRKHTEFFEEKKDSSNSEEREDHESNNTQSQGTNYNGIQ